MGRVIAALVAVTSSLLLSFNGVEALSNAAAAATVASNVRELAWAGPERRTSLTAWSVASSVPSTKDGLFGMSLVMWPHPGARLSLIAQSAEFFVGDVPGLSAVPPDYTENDRDAAASELAGWASPFELVSAVFLDQAPTA